MDAYNCTFCARGSMAAIEPSERQHRGGGGWCPLCLATLTILQQRAVEHATVWLQPICHCGSCRPVHPTMTRMPDPSGPQRRSPSPWQPSAAGHAQCYHSTVGSKCSCPQSAHGAHVLLMEPARLGSPVPEVRTACWLPACPAWQLGRPQLPQKSFCHSCSMLGVLSKERRAADSGPELAQEPHVGDA